MFVRLPGGMTRDTQACWLTMVARALSWSAVSSSTPLGGAEKPSCVGLAAWQDTQRAWMTGWTSAKEAGGPMSTVGRGAAAKAVSTRMTRPEARTSVLAIEIMISSTQFHAWP